MTLRPLVRVALLLASPALLAQTLQPGLWEITQKVQGNEKQNQAMAQMEQQMAAMPPEQRKMMQDMLAKQGVQLGSAPGGGMAIKMCMTREMAERKQVAPERAGCTHSSKPLGEQRMAFSFRCTQPPSQGEGEATFTSPQAYSMRMHVTSQHNGKPEVMDMHTQGRWLGADCGSVKPIGGAAKP